MANKSIYKESWFQQPQGKTIPIHFIKIVQNGAFAALLSPTVG
jgi:hypothetical protein